MDEGKEKESTSLSISTSPVAPLLQCRVLDVPAYPGLLASLDRFEILEVLGSGGMGVVLLARDPTRPAPVAIKILRPELVSEPRAVHRFLVEARHMQRLSHPHVLPMLEVSDRTEGPYFVVPYMAGGSLSKSIQPGKPLPTERILEIATHMAGALTFAHTRGLTHRDLKPGNVLLDNLGNAYLSDFGLVRTVYNDSLIDVRRQQTEGTPAYMPPEIARGEAGDTRADIYSLGALMYEMLTGEPPYEGPSPQQILEQVKSTAPASILSRYPDAHPDLAKVAETAMARELPERYVSMQQMLEDLQRIAVRAVPIGVRGSFLSPRRSKWLLRSMAIVVSLVAIVTLLVPYLRPPAANVKPPALTEHQWIKGTDRVRYQDHPGSTGAGDAVFSNGRWEIHVTAESRQGFAIHQYSWIDLKESLKGREDLEIKVVLNKPSPRSVASIQLCDGAKPSDKGRRAVDLFRVGPTEVTSDATTITLFIYPSIPAALVTETGDLGDARFVDLSPLMGAAGWYLRMLNYVSASGDAKKAENTIFVSDVRVQSATQESTAVVFGRVTHDLSGAGIEGVVVRSTDGALQKKTSPDGFYWLPLPAGEHNITFEHLNYKAPAATSIMLDSSQRRQINQVLTNSSLSLGQVIAAIPAEPAVSGCGFLPWRDGILSVVVTKPEDCMLAFAANPRDVKPAIWKPLVRLQADGNRQEDRHTVDSKGMARVGERIYSIEVWTARLMVLDPERGVIESRVIPNQEWTYGLGFEGKGFWTIELNAGQGIYRLLYIDLKTLEVRETIRCPSDVRSLTFGEGRVWVARGVSGGHVFKLDPNLLRTTKNWESSEVGHFPGDYNSLTFENGELWGYSEQNSRFCNIHIKQ